MRLTRITLIIILGLLLFPADIVYAWERLVTKDGTVIEGDVTQSEFVLTDKSGGEVVIPRAAVDRFQAGDDGLTATLKDGTSLSGTLEEKLEIEDGPIKRRYPGADIEQVEFDRFIAVKSGKKYHSCPIRIDLDASPILLSDRRSVGATELAVNCNDLRILNIAFNRHGKMKSGRVVSVASRFTVSVPEGADQLAELSIELVQGETRIATARKRFTADEGEISTVSLTLYLQATGVTQPSPTPRFRVQLVSQDEDREVNRGGFFWWFTIQL